MDRSFLWKTLQVPCRIVTSLCFDLKVYGRNNVPRRGGVLLAANHQSLLDPVLIGVHLYRPISFLARSGLFENPYFGWLIRSLHAFPVRQGAGDVGAMKETIRRLKEGHLLNIYPEGSRTLTGELGPIEPGVALVVRRAGVPVVPVAIEGSFQAWPKGKKFFRPCPISVMYGRPMHLSDLDSEEIVRRLEQALREMLEELRRKRAARRGH